MAVLKVYDIGKLGLNIDSDPITLEDQELRLAQNVIRDPLGADAGLRKRPGLAVFNTTSFVDIVLGGIVLPTGTLLTTQGTTVYISRGPKS
jgi:hypothetical protein